MYVFQLPELLETIRPKLEMIGFKNFSSISGKPKSFTLSKSLNNEQCKIKLQRGDIFNTFISSCQFLIVFIFCGFNFF